jgi:putative ABC transport system permease protein
MHVDGNFDYFIPPGYGPEMKERFPAISEQVRLADGIGAGVISYKGTQDTKSFREQNIVYADSSFFHAFTFQLENGNPDLSAPQTMALNVSTAKKVFGTTDIVGQVVTVSNQFGNTLYKITGVYKDMPLNSDIQTPVLLSISTLYSKANRSDNDWADPEGLDAGFCNTYMVLEEGADRAALSAQLTEYFRSASPSNQTSRIVLQPFSELHLAPGLGYPYQTFGSLPLVITLFSIALLIIAIAWINYINLSTVQSLKRARETGVRKVLGATRLRLTMQSLSETTLITLISTLLASFLVELLQPVFNRFAGRELSVSVLNIPAFWVMGIGMLVIGILLAGGYVGFVISSFKPIDTLRGKIGTIATGLSLRKGLVIFQFTISTVFIIATLIMYRQLNYMKTADLGINLRSLLVLKGPTVTTDGQAERNYEFKRQLAQLPYVRKVAASNNVPGVGYNFSTEGITSTNPQKDENKKTYRMLISDEHYFDTYGIEFLQGNAFSEIDATRGWNASKKVILNEKAVRQLGYSTKDNLVGKKIRWDQPYEIAGIVRDYHHLSLRQNIEPTIYLPSVSFVYFTIETDLSKISGHISQLEQIYKKLFEGNPFEYFFADDVFQKQYESDQKLGNVCIAAAITAILIACMGLLGIAAFSATQRVKEIGIRKVLGASVESITRLLCRDFIALVVVAILVAIPISWWMMNSWLQNFAYRAPINAWIFLAGASIAMIIAALTIGVQAINASRSNPVKCLRGD